MTLLRARFPENLAIAPYSDAPELRCGAPRALRSRRVGATLLAAAILATSARADDAPLGRLDYDPYRVSVSVTFERDPSITPAFRQEVVTTLGSRIQQTFGATWQTVPATGVRDEEQISPANETGLERLTYASAMERLKPNRCDKAYFLVVFRVGPQWRIAGREWDQTLQWIGPQSSVSTLDRRAIADAAAALLRRLFSPILIVDDADRESKLATLTVRAGSIPFADSQFQPLKKGAVLQPVFRFLDSKRAVQKVQRLPWTYLVLDSIENGRAACAIHSAYRTPLSANLRRRVEAVAVLLRPESNETRLKLVVGRNVSRPVGGLFVSLHPLVADANTPKAVPPQFLSDRNGVVQIPLDPAQPLRRIEIRSGSALLARRPFMPGVEPEMTIDLPDDSVRLATEREIDLLQDRLVGTVARRSALIGRARAASKRTDYDAVRRMIAELERLPGATEYQSQLNKIRVIALDDARRSKDRVAERRIGDLCQKTSELVERYLPEDRIRTFKEEMKDLSDVGKPASAPASDAKLAPAAKSDAVSP